MLDYRIRTFLTLCETLNYRRTGEALGLSQPAVGHQIHTLEDEYGCRLFIYDGRRLSPTPQADRLAEYARAAVYNQQQLLAALRADGARTVRVGATKTIGEYVAAEAFSRYAQRTQGGFCVTVDNTETLLRMLEREELDFALVEGYFPRRDYGCLLCSQEPYVAVCARDEPLPASPCRLEDLLDRRLILREPGSGTRCILEKYLEARSLSVEDFPRRTELGNLGAIKALVARGCGITFLYQRAAQAELDAGTLRCIPLADLSITHDFSFIWRRDSIFASEYRQVFSDLLGRSLPAGEETP